MKAGVVLGGAALVVGGGVLGINALLQADRRHKQELADHLASLPEPVRQAVGGARTAYRAADGTVYASTMAAGAGARDAGHAASLVARWNTAYHEAPGTSEASGIIATAAVDRGWPNDGLKEKVDAAYHDAPGTAEASAILAITKLDTGATKQQLEDAYHDSRGPAFASAIFADAAIRHHLGADEVKRRSEAIDDLASVNYEPLARLTAAQIESGATPQAVAAMYDTINDRTNVSYTGAGVLAAGAIAAGVGADVAIERYEQMERHLDGPRDSAAFVVANRLWGEAHAGQPAPTWLYAIEDDDDD